jgi:histidine ammonia-lyase
VSAEWRLAVGLFTSEGDDASREARLQLALWAAREGYALVEAFVVAAGQAENAYVAAEDLAVRVDAQAVLVLGDVHRERVEKLAQRARLMVFAIGDRRSGSAGEGLR